MEVKTIADVSSFKTWLLTAFGIVLSTVTEGLGGYDHFLNALLIFMAVDLITGFLVAVVFKNSDKTETGRLSSGAWLKGLAKKVGMLLMIVIAVLLDGLLTTGTLTRNAVIIALGIGELISIMENISRMGITMPQALTNALEMLNVKQQRL
jgi:toxin secretion/phage lysis holin